MFNEAWRKDPKDDRSERENDIVIRGYGEAGWEHGWDPYDVTDQLAHLGEMVCELALIERDPGVRAMYALENDDGSDDNGAAFVEALRASIAQDSFELPLLANVEITRDLLKQAAQKWHERHSGK